ncbi:ATP-binding protein [Lentzea sp. NEAU-D7]|uniref:ATP-binding protein n=1 Tax=Lentzea sp. NEAU-D7 TaxID=2994667 RepID=UPI00224A60C4|nr:ATP-binding protein [Lentzea sp. NEAU-D7]MCX2950023.1 ATP-binding protein [Lentzea sp. NEAU-D7]
MAGSALVEAVFSLPENDRRGGVALAREFARRAAQRCGYRGHHEDVVLVVNELTTNAVCHGSGRPVVHISGGEEQVLVEVVDDAAAPRAPGWGLQLVAVLGESWGVLERAGQNVVWCELTA